MKTVNMSNFKEFALEHEIEIHGKITRHKIVARKLHHLLAAKDELKITDRFRIIGREIRKRKWTSLMERNLSPLERSISASL